MIPTPKYEIGAVVYLAGIVTTKTQLPCPDCLGTKKWTIITPAGAEMSCACLRCGSLYPPRTVAGEQLPSLVTQRYEPVVTSHTISGVRIDTRDTDHPISYTCTNNSFYYESQLYADEETAMVMAQLKVDDLQATRDATPQALRDLKFSQIPLDLAGNHADWESVYRAWDYARWHAESIQDVIDNVDAVYHTRNDIVDYLTDRGAELRRYQFIHPHPLEVLLRAALDGQDVRKIALEIVKKYPLP